MKLSQIFSQIIVHDLIILPGAKHHQNEEKLKGKKSYKFFKFLGHLFGNSITALGLQLLRLARSIHAGTRQPLPRDTTHPEDVNHFSTGTASTSLQRRPTTSALKQRFAAP